MEQIDISAVKELARLKADQDVVQSYLARASELKERVSEVVYRRVLEDYNGRNAAIENQAAPLREKAREEYRKLRALLDELKAALDRATVDKQELEFRHVVGELEPDELAERLKHAERAVGERQGAFAEAEAIEEQFVSAFGSRETLEEPGDDSTLAREIPRPEKAAYLDQTNMAAIGTFMSTQTSVPVAPVAPEPPPDAGTDKTFIVPHGLLVIEREEARVEYPLSAINYIGRTPENQIQLASPGVSRKHAVVMVGSAGSFMLKDLESQNGTFVNEDRIQERDLKHGDRIRIGNVDLLFQLS